MRPGTHLAAAASQNGKSPHILPQSTEPERNQLACASFSGCITAILAYAALLTLQLPKQ